MGGKEKTRSTSARPSASTSQNTSVRVAVVGDKGTGKTSLIIAAATDSFTPNTMNNNNNNNKQPVLPPTR